MLFDIFAVVKTSTNETIALESGLTNHRPKRYHAIISAITFSFKHSSTYKDLNTPLVSSKPFFSRLLVTRCLDLYVCFVQLHNHQIDM
jgi:hypothetical protein